MVKQKELKALNDKKAKTSVLHPVEHIRLNDQIDEVLKEWKQLKAEKSREIGLLSANDDAGVRPVEEECATAEIKQSYGKAYEADLLKSAKADVAKRMGETPVIDKPRSVRRDLQQAQEKVKQREQERRQQSFRKKSNDRERYLRYSP